ncbi:LysR family transcriptional regulator [Pseudomonas savastanoi]|uniref:Transcriptional regulator, LysR-family n=1 Tax=Pseudomonas savastanoi pv. phaseolicola TaxID=319 RepID=A0ABD4BD69_PSESH|nr:LysR family transcriptional regulator [Pseudomonas savastanoi]KPY14316.1 Transcriptional regulator, LysR-family [Pseudomonas savastanoi pv. phaseolicola]
MELRHLRYFITVAEHLSVSKAARHLHIVQPALSRQIRELEQDLGVDLFRRSSKGVELTPAGEQFIRDARAIMTDLQNARERVARIANGQYGALRIGIAPNYSWHPSILRPLREFKRLQPDVTLMLEPALAARQQLKIADGKLDGGFLAWRDPKNPVLSGLAMFNCRLVLAVPRDSELHLSPPMHLADLQNQQCVWFSRDKAPSYYDFLINSCHVAGLSPQLVHLGADINTVLGLVGAGMGYSIVPDSSQYNCPSEVALVPHPELTGLYTIEFVWRSDSEDPALWRLVDHFKSG